MSMYMGRPTVPATGHYFALPRQDKPLRKDCHKLNGRFHSVLKWKGNKINLGVFETEDECNAVWDRSKKRRVIKARPPAVKGYTKATVGEGQRVNLTRNGVYGYLGTFPCEKTARAAYLVAFYAEKKRQLDELK